MTETETTTGHEPEASTAHRLVAFESSVLRVPRLLRIMLVLVISLAVTLAISPLIDDIYVRYLFDENTLILPSLVTATAGSLVYLIGWYLIAGRRKSHDLPSRHAIAWYLLMGALALILDIILILQGLSMTA